MKKGVKGQKVVLELVLDVKVPPFVDIEGLHEDFLGINIANNKMGPLQESSNLSKL